MLPPYRVVITGIGLESALGCTPHAVQQAFQEQDPRHFVPSVSCGLAGYAVCPLPSSAEEDEARQRLLRWRRRNILNRGAQAAVLAGLRAVSDAGFSAETPLPQETPMIAASGPMLDITAEQGLPVNNQQRAPHALDPADALAPELSALWLLRWLPNTATSALGLLLGLHGEALTVNAACASATQALGQAFLRIRAGLDRRILVITGDSRLSQTGLLGYAKARVLCQRPDTAATTPGPRPFDRARDGFAPGEGGAAFILEEQQTAQARNASCYAEILGYGASCDAFSLTGPEPSGKFASTAVHTALSSAHCTPSSLHWVAAHGTGTTLNDQMESALLEQLFAGVCPSPAILALKSWLGHTGSACGGIELACLLAAWQNNCMPPVLGLTDPLSSALTFVQKPTPFAGPLGLLQSFGFGGQNAALILRCLQGQDSCCLA